MTLTGQKQVCSVEEAGRILGVGRSAAYEAARRGDLPTIRLGRRLVVPLRALERMLEEPGRTKERNPVGA